MIIYPSVIDRLHKRNVLFKHRLIYICDGTSNLKYSNYDDFNVLLQPTATADRREVEAGVPGM